MEFLLKPEVEDYKANKELETHLDMVHKFRWCDESQCNRSDNFRNHLKKVHQAAEDRLSDLMAKCEIKTSDDDDTMVR